MLELRVQIVLSVSPDLDLLDLMTVCFFLASCSRLLVMYLNLPNP